jgi:gluconolactonase
MSYFAPPPTWESRVFARLPERFRRAERSSWAQINRPHRATDSFLEAPCFDRSGCLCVADIPFGRLFRIDHDGNWDLLVEYEGWPNGLKLDRDGAFVIADHRHGLMRLEAQSKVVTPLLQAPKGREFRGTNDLTFGAAGEIYFTDQG